jgi:hypothetical protein
LIYIVAAANSGPNAATISSPAGGKNVITVGASENVRPDWTDGCGDGPSGADNANDVAGFSSRGPAPGNRVKPEIIAPGSHIQSGASNFSGYTGTGVCDKYHPDGQTEFAASSGTSHSTPAVSGIASLAYWWIEHGGGAHAGLCWTGWRCRWCRRRFLQVVRRWLHVGRVSDHVLLRRRLLHVHLDWRDEWRWWRFHLRRRWRWWEFLGWRRCYFLDDLCLHWGDHLCHQAGSQARYDSISNQDVQQNDNGNACKVLPGAFLVVREIHACFLQYQLFLLLLNPKMAT